MHLHLFDLDHTLLTENCSYRFGNYLYRKGVFSTFKMLRLSTYYALHKLGFLSLQSLHEHSFQILFKGMPYNTIEKHITDFLDESLHNMLYHPVCQLLKDLRQTPDHYSIILSSSPDFLVRPIGQRLGVKESYGTDYKLDNQQIFCQIAGVLDGDQKALIAAKLMQKLDVKISNTTAYSDSIQDLPLLEAAGRVVAVNPDRSLRKLSAQNHWEII